MLKRLFTLLMACAATLGLTLGAAAAEPQKLATGWLDEHEAFIMWLAKEKGWDKEAGLDVEMLRFDSGKVFIEGMKVYKWILGGCGIVPTVLGRLRLAVRGGGRGRR